MTFHTIVSSKTRASIIGSIASMALLALPAMAEESSPPSAEEAFDLTAIDVAPPLEMEFPYVSIPDGYRYWGSSNGSKNYALERFPFWAGDHYEWVEGRFSARILRGPQDRDWSDFEVNRHYEDYLASIGAVQASVGRGDKEQRDAVFTDYIRSQFSEGLENCDTAQRTWVIRQADSTIWMQLCGTGRWIVGETEVTPEADKPAEQPQQPQAEVRSADELEQALTETGKVDVPGIFFELDSAELLAESQDALEQMAALLSSSDYPVTIAGHTDNQGEYDYNMMLSEQRAQAVRQVLVDQYDIDGDRLVAEGFGFTEPVASNDTEEGRAQNRRVELIAEL